MIKKLLPLTENKLSVLRYIYDNKDAYLLSVSKALGIHPFSLKRTVDNLIQVRALDHKQVGRTSVLSINKLELDIMDVLLLIEQYKTETMLPKAITKNILAAFVGYEQVLSCCVFGSYARRGATKNSDLDLMFIVKDYAARKSIIQGCSELATSIGIEVSPVIFSGKDFKIALGSKDPGVASVLGHAQRLIIIGAEEFLRLTSKCI